MRDCRMKTKFICFYNQFCVLGLEGSFRLIPKSSVTNSEHVFNHFHSDAVEED